MNLRCPIVSLLFVTSLPLFAVGQAHPNSPEVIRTTAQLVVLDATVLDKSGHIVTTPLTRDDFQVLEDKRPQAIYSFESQNQHAAAAGRGETGDTGLVIFVLDELNYSYVAQNSSAWNVQEQASEYAYERNQVAAFLQSQPARLQQRTEVLVFTEHGFRTLAEPTQDRDLVLQRVLNHKPALGQPFRLYLEETGGGSGQVPDRTLSKASMAAIWTLALEERSVPGRKLVLWMGYGGPNQDTARPVQAADLTPVERHTRAITDLLLDARITLDVLAPGGSPTEPTPEQRALGLATYQFESDFGFSGYINATGGQWQNGNDIRGEIQAASNYAASVYTLSYRPTDHDYNGDFRRIQVHIRNHPDWIVLTKAGYYAMQFGGEKDEDHQLQTDIEIATFGAAPFSAIGATLASVERIKGTPNARFTFRLDSGDLQWTTDPERSDREADLTVSGAALGSEFKKSALAGRVSTWKLTAPSSAKPSSIKSVVSVTLPVLRKTRRLRFVIRDSANGRMGTIDVPPAAVAQAPEIAAPALPLNQRETATPEPSSNPD